MTAVTPLQATDGFVSRLLANVGVPYAGSIADAIMFLLAFVLVYLAGRRVALPLLDRFMDVRGMDAHARKPLRKLGAGLVVFVALAVAFGAAGFTNFLTSLATIAAAGTLAVGFAMQEVIRNFVAGVFIFTDRPFRIGDWIEWDDYSGVVEDISLRVTRVRTFDNELLTVPNSNLTDDVIKNPVAMDTLRVPFTFGVGYGDDVEGASEIIVEAAREHPSILDDPEPTVRLMELADSYVGLQARVWIADPSRSDVVRIRSEFVGDVKERFDAAGIDIPFPQLRLSGGIDVDEGPVAEALGGTEN